MIEEPKKVGFFWVQRHATVNSTTIWFRDANGTWFDDGGYHMGKWSEHGSPILRIEPVAPPSWERKPT